MRNIWLPGLAGVAGIALVAAWSASGHRVQAQPAAPQSIEVSARPIVQFEIGSGERNFGPLVFVGGLELTSPSRSFGAFSGIRLRDSGGAFRGVADTGLWFSGRIVRDRAGAPAGWEAVEVAPIVDEDGAPIESKVRGDAEGVAVEGETAVVSFERDHRIHRYRLAPGGLPEFAGRLDFLVPARELRRNAGFETVAKAPADGALAGALVAVTEKSLDSDGNIFAAVLDGPRRGVFTVVRSGYDVTDGAFLPDGDLLILERHFALPAGVSMRIRRIPEEAIGAGQVADGPVLIEADMGYQIDNMEGLDVWRREDGALMVSLVSDDNQSILQRNLYLEFVLVD